MLILMEKLQQLTTGRAIVIAASRASMSVSPKDDLKIACMMMTLLSVKMVFEVEIRGRRWWFWLERSKLAVEVEEDV